MKTNDVVIKTTTKVVSFIIFLFSVYIFFAGHYTPGGGFVGGLLASSAVVLLMLAYDLKTVKRILPINFIKLTAVGIVLSIVTASIGIFVDKPFFTHFFDDFYLPLFHETSLHTATLFDLGVYFVVIGVTMTIIQTIGEDD